MEKSREIPATPLTEALANIQRPKADPIEVFKMARKAWLRCERINIGEIAKELGVSRATVYRWVGSRERLIEEILWSFGKPSFENAVKDSPGHGVDHIVEVHRRFMLGMVTFEPMWRYISQNPVTAIGLQTNVPHQSHGRLINLTRMHLEQQIEAGHISIPIPAEEMAEMLIVTNGSLLYMAIIGNRNTDTAIAHACAIDRMMLTGAFAVPSPLASD